MTLIDNFERQVWIATFAAIYAQKAKNLPYWEKPSVERAVQLADDAIKRLRQVKPDLS